MLQSVRRWFAKRQRQIDIDTLFPVIREECATTEQAAYAIWAHMIRDPAWSKSFTIQQLEALAREHAHDTI